jgi:hypothetical protein
MTRPVFYKNNWNYARLIRGDAATVFVPSSATQCDGENELSPVRRRSTRRRTSGTMLRGSQGTVEEARALGRTYRPGRRRTSRSTLDGFIVDDGLGPDDDVSRTLCVFINACFGTRFKFVCTR